MLQRGERGGVHYGLGALAVRSAGLGAPAAEDLLADRLLPDLRRRGKLTNPDARALLATETATARRVLQRLVARGQAERRGVGRGTYYVPR